MTSVDSCTNKVFSNQNSTHEGDIKSSNAGSIVRTFEIDENHPVVKFTPAAIDMREHILNRPDIHKVHIDNLRKHTNAALEGFSGSILGLGISVTDDVPGMLSHATKLHLADCDPGALEGACNQAKDHSKITCSLVEFSGVQQNLMGAIDESYKIFSQKASIYNKESGHNLGVVNTFYRTIGEAYDKLVPTRSSNGLVNALGTADCVISSLVSTQLHSYISMHFHDKTTSSQNLKWVLELNDYGDGFSFFDKAEDRMFENIQKQYLWDLHAMSNRKVILIETVKRSNCPRPEYQMSDEIPKLFDIVKKTDWQWSFRSDFSYTVTFWDLQKKAITV